MAYIVRADIETQFLPDEIDKWADPHNNDDQTAIDAQVAASIVHAEARVNDELRGGPYAVPLTATTIPQAIIEATAIIAGIWLYEKRGVVEVDSAGDPVDRFMFRRTRVQDMLRRIKGGFLRLELDVEVKDYPEVISET